jgi:hypothetical protein
MFRKEIIAVCWKILTEHVNTLCGRKVEFLNCKSVGTYSNHLAFKGFDYAVTININITFLNLININVTWYCKDRVSSCSVYVIQLDTQYSFMVDFIHNIYQLYSVSDLIAPSSGASFKLYERIDKW